MSDVTVASSMEVIFSEGAAIARATGRAAVWMLPDGRLVKQFRIRPLFSSATLRPIVRRFARNARLLAARGVPTVRIAETHRLRSPRRDLVVYHPLEGETLRAFLRARPGEMIETMHGLARFIGSLHERGVYFRGLHFGNVIVTPEGEFGLIDIDSAEFRRGPLPVTVRERNFRPMFAYEEDARAMATMTAAAWIESYTSATAVTMDGRARLTARLEGHLADRLHRSDGPIR